MNHKVKKCFNLKYITILLAHLYYIVEGIIVKSYIKNNDTNSMDKNNKDNEMNEDQDYLHNDMSSNEDDINTTCTILLCIERIEQILMTYGYIYNDKFKLFEKSVMINKKNNKEISYLRTVCIDQKSNKAYYILIDKRLDITTVNKENKPSQIQINYLGHVPNSELDFLILCNLMNIKELESKDEIDNGYFDMIINRFKKLLTASGYQYCKSNNKYFKQIITYTDIPVFMSIYIDTQTDTLQISEEYSQSNLLTDTISNNQNQESVLPIYSGRIPKTKFEFHTISNLIDLYLD